MSRLLHLCIALAGTLALAMVWPLTAQASPQLFVDQGCYNCHGVAKGGAPSIETLSKRFSRFKGDAAAEQKTLEEFRVGELFGRIDSHERVSPESAKTLIHWLVEGAK